MAVENNFLIERTAKCSVLANVSGYIGEYKIIHGFVPNVVDNKEDSRLYLYHIGFMGGYLEASEKALKNESQKSMAQKIWSGSKRFKCPELVKLLSE